MRRLDGGLVGANDEHRAGRFVEDRARHAAVEQPANGAPAVRADHDQARVVLRRDGADLFGDRAGGVHELAADAGLGRDGLGARKRVVHVLVLHLRQLRDDVRVAVVAVRGNGHVLDRDGDEGRVEGGCELDRAQRCLGGRR